MNSILSRKFIRTSNLINKRLYPSRDWLTRTFINAPGRDLIIVAKEVKVARSLSKPIVALQSSIYTHGWPYPDNIHLAFCLQDLIRSHGATPATIGIIDGVARVGLSDRELVTICTSANNPTTMRVTGSSLPFILGTGIAGRPTHGGTTISSTMILAHWAGISVLGSYDLGGVHFGGQDCSDISAGLMESRDTPIAVIDSGFRNPFDTTQSLKLLEAQGVTVATYADGRSSGVNFPEFLTRDSGVKSSNVYHNPMEAAAVLFTLAKLSTRGNRYSRPGALFANPIPEEHSLLKTEADQAICSAIGEAANQGIRGDKITPFLLAKVGDLTKGRSLLAIRASLESNVVMASKIAVQLASLWENDILDVQKVLLQRKNQKKGSFSPNKSDNSIKVDRNIIKNVSNTEPPCQKPVTQSPNFHGRDDINASGSNNTLVFDAKESDDKNTIELNGNSWSRIRKRYIPSPYKFEEVKDEPRSKYFSDITFHGAKPVNHNEARTMNNKPGPPIRMHHIWFPNKFEGTGIRASENSDTAGLHTKQECSLNDTLYNATALDSSNLANKIDFKIEGQTKKLHVSSSHISEESKVEKKKEHLPISTNAICINEINEIKSSLRPSLRKHISKSDVFGEAKAHASKSKDLLGLNVKQNILPDIAVFGATVIDLTCNLILSPNASFSTDLQPVMNASNMSRHEYSIGGTGHNIALAAHLVSGNQHVTLCSLVGDDLSGSMTIQLLKSETLDVSGIKVLPKVVQRSGVPVTNKTAQYVAVNDGKKDLVLGMAGMQIFRHNSYVCSKSMMKKLKWAVIDGNWNRKVVRGLMSLFRKEFPWVKIAFEPAGEQNGADIFRTSANVGEYGGEISHALDVFPNHKIDLITLEIGELNEMFCAATSNGYFDNDDHWHTLDALGIFGVQIRDRYRAITGEKLTEEGVPFQTVYLLPYVTTIITKLDYNTILLTELIKIGDPRLNDPEHERWIISRSRDGHMYIGGIYMRKYAAVEIVDPADIVSNNGVADSFLGVLVAGLSRGLDLDENLIDVAQKGATMTLQSKNVVSQSLGELTRRLNQLALSSARCKVGNSKQQSSINGLKETGISHMGTDLLESPIRYIRDLKSEDDRNSLPEYLGKVESTLPMIYGLPTLKS